MAARDDPDVLVVGAGVVGLYCADFLARQGLSVTVVDSYAVGSPQAASSGNTGLVAHGGAPLAASPGLVTIAPGADPGWLRHFHAAGHPDRVAASTRALRALKTLSLELLAAAAPDPSVEFGRLLLAYRSKEGLEQAARNAPGPVLSPADLAELEPGVEFDVAGALVQEGVAFLRTPDHLAALVAGLTAHGVELCEHTPVYGLETSGGKVVAVRTAHGELRPAETVIATGEDPAGAVQPIRGYVLSMPTPPGAPRGPLLLAEGHVAVRPLGDRLRVAGGFTLTDVGPEKRSVEAVLATLRAHVPGLEVPDDFDVWTGFRPVTPDSLPLLGRPAALSNVVVARGHGHVGMGLAPATGRLVAQLVAGERPDLDLTPFDPDRFGRLW